MGFCVVSWFVCWVCLVIDVDEYFDGDLVMVKIFVVCGVFCFVVVVFVCFYEMVV